jgi:hypothetical protein
MKFRRRPVLAPKGYCEKHQKYAALARRASLELNEGSLMPHETIDSWMLIRKPTLPAIKKGRSSLKTLNGGSLVLRGQFFTTLNHS